MEDIKEAVARGQMKGLALYQRTVEIMLNKLEQARKLTCEQLIDADVKYFFSSSFLIDYPQFFILKDFSFFSNLVIPMNLISSQTYLSKLYSVVKRVLYS